VALLVIEGSIVFHIRRHPARPVSLLLGFLFWISALICAYFHTGPVAIAFALLTTFEPPFAWVEVPADETEAYPGLVGAWYEPEASTLCPRQNITVVRVRARGSIGNLVNLSLSRMQYHPEMKFIGRQLNQQCPKVSQVVLFETIVNGFNIVEEQVYTIEPGELFVATYMREKGEPASVGARRAVQSLCPIAKTN
jgi:hypothetical protein